jgi:hypothetical protein
MTRARQLSRLLTLALALGTAGCGKLREVSACRSIARQVNTAADEVEALSKAKPVDELRLAKRYAELAKALEPRSAGQAPLALAVRDYVVILHGTEAGLRTQAQLLKTPNGRLNESRRELERLAKREHAAATRIDVECHN